MKTKTTPTLEGIRQTVMAYRGELLQEVWQHFLKEGKWPNVRTLFSKQGTAKVREALIALGGSVGREENGPQGRSQCKLSLLGVLLTNNGPINQALLTRFFNSSAGYFGKSLRRSLRRLLKL